MIRPKNETEDLLLSITKHFETLIEQTHKKAEETLDYKFIKSRETFLFNPPIQKKKSLDDRINRSRSIQFYF